MIDDVAMRKIYIEGKDEMYLMDPQGRIYDMQVNWIGNADPEAYKETDNKVKCKSNGILS